MCVALKQFKKKLESEQERLKSFAAFSAGISLDNARLWWKRVFLTVKLYDASDVDTKSQSIVVNGIFWSALTKFGTQFFGKHRTSFENNGDKKIYEQKRATSYRDEAKYSKNVNLRNF